MPVQANDDDQPGKRYCLDLQLADTPYQLRL